MQQIIVLALWMGSGVASSLFIGAPEPSRWAWAPIAAVLGPLWAPVAFDQRNIARAEKSHDLDDPSEAPAGLPVGFTDGVLRN